MQTLHFLKHATKFEESFPDAHELPQGSEAVAAFAFNGGMVVLARQDLDDHTSFLAVECFPGGGQGFSGGGPGETWRGCTRIDYSDAGYAIAIIEDPSWRITVDGQVVDVVPAGDVGAAVVEGTFTTPPSSRSSPMATTAETQCPDNHLDVASHAAKAQSCIRG